MALTISQLMRMSFNLQGRCLFDSRGKYMNLAAPVSTANFHNTNFYQFLTSSSFFLDAIGKWTQVRDAGKLGDHHTYFNDILWTVLAKTTCFEISSHDAILYASFFSHRMLLCCTFLPPIRGKRGCNCMEVCQQSMRKKNPGNLVR